MNMLLLMLAVRSAYPSGGGGGYVFNGTYGAATDAGETDDPLVDATLYSGSTTYALGAMVSLSGSYWISEKDGNVGNALTDATSWYAITAFMYIDAASGSDSTRALATDPTTAKAAPFQTLPAMNNRTSNASGYTAAPAGTLFLLKRGDIYYGNVQFEFARAYAGCWGTRGSARPIVHRRNNYMGPGIYNATTGAIRGSNTVGQWRLRNIDINGDDLVSLACSAWTGTFQDGETITDSAGVQGTIYGTGRFVTAGNIYLDVLRLSPNQLGYFTMGSTVTGGTSGATATVKSGSAGQEFNITALVPAMAAPQKGDWKIMNSEFQKFPGGSVGMGYTGLATSGDNTLFQNCIVHGVSNGNTGQHGAAIGFTEADNARILRCTFYDNSYAGNIFCHHIYSSDSTNSEVAYNNLYSTFRNANIAINFHGVVSDLKIHHNWIHATENGIALTDGYGTAEHMQRVEIYCNKIEDLSTLTGAGQGLAFYLASLTDSVIHSNVVRGCRFYAFSIQDTTGSGGGDTPTNNLKVYNNTIVDTKYGIALNGASLGTVDFQNNIFHSLDAAANPIFKYAAVSDASITLSNNVFYNPNSSNPVSWDGSNYSIAGLASAKSKCAVNTLTSDPLFTNYSTHDFTLQSGSPAKAAGVTGLGITTDFAGNAFGSPPNMGAYA